MFLRDSSMKLYEIGARVGYPNGRYFTKVFTKEIGVPPRQYRSVIMADKRIKSVRPFAGRRARTKMVLIFFVLLLNAVQLFTYYVTRRISAVTQEQTFSAARKTFDETATAVRTRIEKSRTSSPLLTYDDLIYHMASTDPQDYPYILQLEDTRTLSTSLSHLEHLSEVSGIRLYVKNDYLYSTENRYLSSRCRRRALVPNCWPRPCKPVVHHWISPTSPQVSKAFLLHA